MILRFIACFALGFLPTLLFAAEVYKLDPDHTYVIWQVDHFGFSTVSGKFMAEGTLTVDNTKPENSSVNVVIHTDSGNTGVAKLDDILKGKNFFDVAEFPAATFKSTKVVVTGKDTGKVYGTLTLRGISKDVTLDVKLNKQGMHPYFHKDGYGFSATTSLNRSDFNMNGYIPGVSDATKILIQAEAIRAS